MSEAQLTLTITMTGHNQHNPFECNEFLAICPENRLLYYSAMSRLSLGQVLFSTYYLKLNCPTEMALAWSRHTALLINLHNLIQLESTFSMNSFPFSGSSGSGVVSDNFFPLCSSHSSAVQCPDPTLGQNAHQVHHQLSQSPYKYTDRLRFRCDHGFWTPDRQGETIECLHNGEWSSSPLSCQGRTRLWNT